MAPKPAKSMLMALALGKPKGGGAASDEEDSEDVDTGSEAKTAAARDLIAAVKRGDVEGVSRAMSDHYDACVASESDGGGEYEEGEADEEV